MGVLMMSFIFCISEALASRSLLSVEGRDCPSGLSQFPRDGMQRNCERTFKSKQPIQGPTLPPPPTCFMEAHTL